MVNKNTQQSTGNNILKYNRAEPSLVPADYKMPEQYTYMHNFAKELVNDYNRVQEKYMAHDCGVKMVIARYKALKKRMHHLEGSARNILVNMIPDRQKALKLLEESREFRILLTEFHNDVDRLSLETDSMNEVFVPLDNKDQQLTEIFNEYKQFKKDLCESNSIPQGEMYAYEANEQEFLDSLAHITNKQNEFIGVCNLVIDRYNLLIEEVEKTYFHWQRSEVLLEIMKQTILIQYDEIGLVCLN